MTGGARSCKICSVSTHILADCLRVYVVFTSVSLLTLGTLVYCSVSTVSEPKAALKSQRELLLIGLFCESSISQVWNYDP